MNFLEVKLNNQKTAETDNNAKNTFISTKKYVSMTKITEQKQKNIASQKYEQNIELLCFHFEKS